VTTKGNGTFDSSFFKIIIVSKIRPYFDGLLTPVTLKVGAEELFNYTSPMIVDPDKDLERITYTVTPSIDCKCIRFKSS
jgi:hypothetical protein